jgi:predicted dehydrogenase
VLCEKPVCHDYATLGAPTSWRIPKHSKLGAGSTFRYAPAVQYLYHLIREGFIGQPFIYNGYEQNYQWINPDTSMDKRIHKDRARAPRSKDKDPRREAIQVLSLEGYGAPTIDIGLMCTGSDLTQVVGILSNMIPYRRPTNLDTERVRINIDDADIFIGECQNGALFSLQSSFVTIGNYPGIEARIYGSKGAIIVRLVEEFGECQTIKMATPDAVELSNRRSRKSISAGLRERRAMALAVLCQSRAQFRDGDCQRRRGNQAFCAARRSRKSSTRRTSRTAACSGSLCY